MGPWLPPSFLDKLGTMADKQFFRNVSQFVTCYLIFVICLFWVLGFPLVPQAGLRRIFDSWLEY